MIKRLYFFLLLSICGMDVFASHVAGGNITYVNIGPNQYRIRLTLYRDCNSFMQGPFGISAANPFPGPETVYFRSNCIGSPVGLTVQPLPGTGFEVPTPCVDDPSTCNGGTRYGIQRYDWEGVVTLPTSTTAACNEWYFTWGQNSNAGWCCRNNNNSLAGAANGDGKNDRFIVRNLEYYPQAKLYIFNRWGQEVYVSNDYRNDWSASDLESGNYFYHLFVFDQGVESQFKGTVKVMK